MAFFGPKRAKIDPKIDFKKKSEISFFLTMEGSIYSNFQVSNPKNEIRRILENKFSRKKNIGKKNIEKKISGVKFFLTQIIFVGSFLITIKKNMP